MSKTARMIALVVGGLGAGSSLQAGPLPGFALKAQTEHFSFYSRANQKVDADRSERYLARVEDLLGHQVVGRAEYYRYATPQEIAVAAGAYADGLTFAKTRQIHSTREFHAHEIVHLVAGQMGNPGAFFQEGLAVALGNEGRWQGKDVHKLARGQARTATVSALVAGFERMDASSAYAVAGSFVATLIKTHGIAKVAEFFRACGPSGSDRDVAFARAFGRSLDEAGAEWAAGL